MSVPPPYLPFVSATYAAMGDGLTESHREWWRWHFAGQIAAALIISSDIGLGENQRDAVADQAVTRADVLIQHLEARQ